LRANFKARDPEVFLTRWLFCLFAVDTEIFGENGICRRLMESTRYLRCGASDSGIVACPTWLQACIRLKLPTGLRQGDMLNIRMKLNCCEKSFGQTGVLSDNHSKVNITKKALN